MRRRSDKVIRVEVRDAQLQRRLTDLARYIADRNTPNKKASIDLYGFVARNFQQEGALVGGWAPLAPSTVEDKAKHGYSLILQNTGQLRQSFVPFSDKEQAGVGAQRLSGLSDGRPADLAAIHQEGAGRIPARPMLPSREQALEIGIRVYDLHIEQARRKANV